LRQHTELDNRSVVSFALDVNPLFLRRRGRTTMLDEETTS
jgi:hypothetical protein